MLRRSAVLVAVVVLAACATSTAPGASTSAAPIPVIFMAGYKPQADLPFVAAYVAQERGYFRQEGLDVTIRHSTGQSEHVKLLATGRIQFATADASNVLTWTQESGVPLVAITLFGQKGQQAFAVRADSDIRTPKDWEGRTVGYKGTVSSDYLALLEAAGVDRSKIHEVAVGFDPRILLEKRVDVYPVFKSNEPDTLAKLGAPVRLFDPADYGVRGLGLTYITNREMVDAHPDTVRRFVQATLRGLADAVADRQAAVDTVMKYATGEDPAHQRFMLDAEIADAQSDLTRASGLGAMTRAQWEAEQRLLLDTGVLAKPVDLDQVIEPRFVQSAYRNGAPRFP